MKASSWVTPGPSTLIAFLRERLAGDRLIGVGHRVVHGGLEYTQPVRLDFKVLEGLGKFVPLAPLHQPPIWRRSACCSSVPHTWRRSLASTPRSTVRTRSSRRCSRSRSSCTSRASPLRIPRPVLRVRGLRPAELRFRRGRRPHGGAAPGQRVEHVRNPRRQERGQHDGLHRGGRVADGNALRLGRPGCAAVSHGPARHGSRTLEKLIYNQSGLLGVSGISSDMRSLLTSRDRRAQLASRYLYRIGRELGSLAAALGGLDAIVFTAGIGENAAVVRERVCRDAAWLGVELDSGANAAGARACTQRPAASRPGWSRPTRS